MHVAVSPSVEPADLVPGREVMLNEAMNVVAAHGYEITGEVVTCKEVLDDGRVLVVAQADEERVCRVAASLEGDDAPGRRRPPPGVTLRLRLRAHPQGRGG